MDFGRLKEKRVRLSLGAVGVAHGEMRYFDSRDTELDLDHVMASGALPPAFAAVRIDGEPYWDGGIYSNTPVEAVLDENPRDDPGLRELEAYGCATRMHLVNLLAPRIEGEDLNRDIDFTGAGVRARRAAGHAATRRLIEQRPWQREGALLDGIIVHDAAAEVARAPESDR